MAVDLRKSFRRKPSSNDVKLESMEFEPTPSSILPSQSEVKISGSPSAQSDLIQPGNTSYAKQELQKLYELFNSWLQPEKHSKEEIISQLVIEQFCLTGHYKNRSALKAKWESSGRNMKAFMESLTDDCMKSPVLVHVSMLEQEALFSENMSLKEVITHLKNQSSAKTPRREEQKTRFQTRGTPMKIGDEDRDGYNSSWETLQLNDSIGSQRNIDSLHIIQKENNLNPEAGEVSCGDPSDSRIPGEDAPRSQERSVNAKEIKQDPLSTPDQFASESVPMDQTKQEKPLGKGYQKKAPRGRLHKCEECSRVFRYPCNLLTHQRRHRNERPFVCSVCHRGFYQPSDLRAHQIVHTGEKPFSCDTCGKAFSHKTNLQAHERIHTGEKPYTCPECKTSYRQSSTYHRHLRSCHKRK